MNVFLLVKGGGTHISLLPVFQIISQFWFVDPYKASFESFIHASYIFLFWGRVMPKSICVCTHIHMYWPHGWVADAKRMSWTPGASTPRFLVKIKDTHTPGHPKFWLIQWNQALLLVSKKGVESSGTHVRACAHTHTQLSLSPDNPNKSPPNDLYWEYPSLTDWHHLSCSFSCGLSQATKTHHLATEVLWESNKTWNFWWSFKFRGGIMKKKTKNKNWNDNITNDTLNNPANNQPRLK